MQVHINNYSLEESLRMLANQKRIENDRIIFRELYEAGSISKEKYIEHLQRLFVKV